MADLWFDVDTAIAEAPVNLFPLIDDTDFKSIEADVNYDAAGLTLIWNFVTTAGAYSQTAVTPTDTGGNYDWVEQGNGMFTIEIPASGGASINNDTEGFGWFTGVATGILPWRGPVIGFRDSDLNDKLIDSAWSATRGLAGTAVPDAAADAAGGLPISDAGGLDMDAILGDTNDIQTRIPAALVGGRMDSNMGAVSTDATAADTLELFAEALDQVTGQIDNGTLASDLNTFQCKVELFDDDNGSTDRYSVVFFKNGEPITSGITNPKITVYKDSDGSTLIAEDDLVEVDAAGHYKYEEGTDRVVSGAAYKAKITATIEAATRSWWQPVGRDST